MQIVQFNDVLNLVALFSIIIVFKIRYNIQTRTKMRYRYVNEEI